MESGTPRGELVQMGPQEWRRGRAAFCHDWLKNRFLPALRGAANCLEGKVNDPEVERLFFVEALPSWPSQRASVAGLLDEFEYAISPVATLQQWRRAMGTVESQEWASIAQVSHALWLARSDARRRLLEVSAALKASDEAFAALERVVAAQGSRAELRGSMAALGDRLQELSRRLYALPDEGRHW